MAEHGLRIDHNTLNLWVVHYAPTLEKAFHKNKERPGDRWRMDKTVVSQIAIYRISIISKPLFL